MEKLGISLIRKNFPRGTTAMMQVIFLIFFSEHLSNLLPLFSFPFFFLTLEGNKDLEYECKRALFDYLKDNRCPISLEVSVIGKKKIQK